MLDARVPVHACHALGQCRSVRLPGDLAFPGFGFQALPCTLMHSPSSFYCSIARAGAWSLGPITPVDSRLHGNSMGHDGSWDIGLHLPPDWLLRYWYCNIDSMLIHVYVPVLEYYTCTHGPMHARMHACMGNMGTDTHILVSILAIPVSIPSQASFMHSLDSCMVVVLVRSWCIIDTGMYVMMSGWVDDDIVPRYMYWQYCNIAITTLTTHREKRPWLFLKTSLSLSRPPNQLCTTIHSTQVPIVPEPSEISSYIFLKKLLIQDRDPISPTIWPANKQTCELTTLQTRKSHKIHCFERTLTGGSCILQLHGTSAVKYATHWGLRTEDVPS